MGACFAGLVLVASNSASAAWDQPWKGSDRALVIDAYEFNPIDWQELTSDKRIVGFINKASDGLPPEWNCRGKSGETELLCKNRWWKYSVTKELYMTRRAMAKALGLKWGAYHLARPGNPRAQADHFIDFAEPAPDDLIAIDIEDRTGEWMSLEDAAVFANQIFIRTGRYPVLYTNGSTAKYISDHKATHSLLSRLPLWYARYREDITGLFPETTWPSYALWQFSSMHNCSDRVCPYRVKGAKTDIDVNVSPLDVAGLKAAWPFDDLVTPLERPAAPNLIARLKEKAGEAVATLAGGIAFLAETKPVRAGPPTAAEIATAAKSTTVVASNYAPHAAHGNPVDPLQLLTQTALAERQTVMARDAADAGRAVAADVANAKTTKGAVRAAALGGVEDLGEAMKSVAAIVTDRATAPPVEPARMPSTFGPMEKSKFRQWLLDAEFVALEAMEEASSRGPRPSSSPTVDMAGAEGFGAIGRRIASAFHATR
ncbi:MAG: glycoside hydrolase family 25 protein [Rhizobiaceae bacterium]|nr:glycoside hydrolase family 25 protein [Rhizobiaceae bacterium]